MPDDAPARAARLLALAEWAAALAADVAHEAGTPPCFRPLPLGGADAILCAAELLMLAAEDVDERDEAMAAAYSAAGNVLSSAQADLADARMASGLLATGYCTCGEYVGVSDGRLMPCPLCDRDEDAILGGEPDTYTDEESDDA